MTNSVKNQIKDQITADLQKARDEGKLRTERIREIVKQAVSYAVAELKEGSGEIRLIAKEAISAAFETLKDRGQDIKEEISASIEGAIEGISDTRRRSIAQTESEIQRLQSQITDQEKELQTEIDHTLNDIESSENGSSIHFQSAVQSAVRTIRDSEEVALMQKRYAQLQTQLALLKANLITRYGEPYEEAKKYLDDARNWYQKAQERAPVYTPDERDRVHQKQAEFEQKMTEAGAALARREQQVRLRLKDVWHSFIELINSEKTNES